MIRTITADAVKPEREETTVHRLPPAPSRIVKDAPVNAEWVEYLKSQRDKESRSLYLTSAHQQADNRAVRSTPRTEAEIQRVREIEETNMAVRVIAATAMKPPKTTGGLVANLSDVNSAWEMVLNKKVTKDNPIEVELEPATIEYLKKANPDIKPVNAAVNLFRRRFKDEGLPFRAFANAGEKAIFTIVYDNTPHTAKPRVAAGKATAAKK